jgi:hypothetical protein
MCLREASMNNADRFKRWLGAILTVTLIIAWCPGKSRAESSAIKPSDVRYSEPFELTAKIMEVDYGKNILIVAEYEIYVVDLRIGAEYIHTDLSDPHGRAIPFDSLNRGQSVRVIGMKLPDGRVVAEELVRLSDSIEN